MADLVKSYKCRDAEKRIPVVKMELDYELAILHEAMYKKNTYLIDECKDKLEKLRKEMIMLEVWS